MTQLPFQGTLGDGMFDSWFESTLNQHEPRTPSHVVVSREVTETQAV